MLRLRFGRPLVAAALSLLVWPYPLLVLAYRAPVPVIASARSWAEQPSRSFDTQWQTTMQREIPTEVLSRVSAYDWFGSLISSRSAMRLSDRCLRPRDPRHVHHRQRLFDRGSPSSPHPSVRHIRGEHRRDLSPNLCPASRPFQDGGGFTSAAKRVTMEFPMMFRFRFGYGLHHGPRVFALLLLVLLTAALVVGIVALVRMTRLPAPRLQAGSWPTEVPRVDPALSELVSGTPAAS